jgi:hypothetical protein
MRLANDLAGFAREREHGEVNAVSIMAQQFEERPNKHSGEESIHEAKQAIRQRIQMELQAARELVLVLNSPTGSEWRIYRASQCGIEIYLAKDFRDWNGENGVVSPSGGAE